MRWHIYVYGMKTLDYYIWLHLGVVSNLCLLFAILTKSFPLNLIRTAAAHDINLSEKGRVNYNLRAGSLVQLGDLSSMDGGTLYVCTGNLFIMVYAAL